MLEVVHRMGRKLAGCAGRLGFVAACSALAACAVVSSEVLAPGSTAGNQRGAVTYALPTGLADITLFVKNDAAEYRLFVSELYVADPNKRFVMDYKPLPNYQDDITIKVRSNLLLESIRTDTEDKTGEIIVALAKAARELRFQSAPVGDDFKKVANIKIDPTEPAQVARAAAFLSSKVRTSSQARYAASCTDAAARKTRLCRTYARYGSAGSPDIVELVVEPPAALDAQAVAADCSVGLCYRVKEPYIVKHTIDGVRQATIVQLPNKSPLIELDVSRAFFVKKVQTINFDSNGFLTSASFDKKSELKAIASLPLQVVTAISSTLPIRYTIQERQNSLAEAQLASLDASEALARAREETSPPTGEPN